MTEREIPEQPIDAQGEHRSAPDTVYALVRPEHTQPLLEGQLTAPENLPLREALGNDLIDSWATLHDYQGSYRPGMRQGAIYAFPDPVPTEEIPQVAGGPRTQVALDVEPDQVYAAQLKDDLPLYHSAWRRAQSHLVAQGLSPAMVDEALEFVAEEPDLEVVAGRSLVSHMPPQVRTPLLEYFDAPIRAYVESFQSLSAYRQHPEGDNVEVIIPGGQIKAARQYQEGA